jgi:hypothetical protein
MYRARLLGASVGNTPQNHLSLVTTAKGFAGVAPSRWMFDSPYPVEFYIVFLITL